VAVRKVPETLRKLFRELWISPAVMGFSALVGTFAVVSSGREHPVICGPS
jgi:heme A synthase